jgi:hypothetical protein
MGRHVRQARLNLLREEGVTDLLAATDIERPTRRR